MTKFSGLPVNQRALLGKAPVESILIQVMISVPMPKSLHWMRHIFTEKRSSPATLGFGKNVKF